MARQQIHSLKNFKNLIQSQNKRGLRLAAVLLLATTFGACSSAPSTEADPAWTRLSSRTIDNGYIVYVESTGASDSNRGRFLSEAQALMDVRNECTLIPKGTRIEDRYERVSAGAHEVFVKVGVEFQECEQAKHAVTTDEVQKLANLPMTEEVKRLEDEQKAPNATELAENEQDLLPPKSSTSSGTQYAYNDTTHYYIIREQVAEDKQFVILNPGYYSNPGYAAPPPPGPGAPASVTPTPTAITASHGPQVPPAGFDQQAMNQRLAERSQNVQQFEQAHPQVRSQTQPWSQVRNTMVRSYKTRADQARRSGMQQKRPQAQQQQPKSSGRRRRQRP